MMLLEEDISRIRELGYKEEFFAREFQGYKILKNTALQAGAFFTTENVAQFTKIDQKGANCILQFTTWI